MQYICKYTKHAVDTAVSEYDVFKRNKSQRECFSVTDI